MFIVFKSISLEAKVPFELKPLLSSKHTTAHLRRFHIDLHIYILTHLVKLCLWNLICFLWALHKSLFFHGPIQQKLVFFQVLRLHAVCFFFILLRSVERVIHEKAEAAARSTSTDLYPSPTKI